jgi:tetratricopeptide (TPR) repeat protein
VTTMFKKITQLMCAVTLSGITISAHAQVMPSPTDRDLAARSAYARGDTALSAATLSESVRLNPFDAVALNNLAVNYATQGDYQNAIALLERAQRIAPNRADIVNNLANLRAWMTQDSQFTLGSRGVPQSLNLPRAEDAPREFPPLWTPAIGATTQPQTQPNNTAPQVKPQPLYQQQANPPVAAQPLPVSSQLYAQPQVTMTPSVYASKSGTSHTRRTTMSERISDSTRSKKKKLQAVDCPVP